MPPTIDRSAADTNPKDRARERVGVERPWSLAQGIVAALLAVSLTFIVVSNYVGWTAQVEVTAVRRDCPSAECRQKVYVKGRGQPFRVAADSRVEVGDRAEIHGKCTPSCKLELVSVAQVSNPH